MNLSKTNKIGLGLINTRFYALNKTIQKHTIKAGDNDTPNILINGDLFKIQSETKIIRVTEKIISNAKLIDFENIKDNISVLDFDFDNIVILLDNDNSGIIKINRHGSDFHFIYLKELDNDIKICLDLYSFISKEFFQESINNKEDLSFVVKLITYLFYGEITTKILPPKSKSKINFYSSFNNDSNLNIIYADSNWKQRISVNGFSVSGHFRLQPIGEKRAKRKLIWIDEFKKQGYNRKATIEKL